MKFKRRDFLMIRKAIMIRFISGATVEEIREFCDDLQSKLQDVDIIDDIDSEPTSYNHDPECEPVIYQP